MQELLERLHTSEARGAFIRPSDKYNKPSDFYGIFKTVEKEGHILVRFQVKDWFKDSAGKEDIVQSWRKYDGVCKSSITLDDGSEVPVASVLFSANELQQTVEIKPNEGVVTINGMGLWLPTAAHALQTFTHLRKLFPFKQEE